MAYDEGHFRMIMLYQKKLHKTTKKSVCPCAEGAQSALVLAAVSVILNCKFQEVLKSLIISILNRLSSKCASRYFAGGNSSLITDFT